MRFSNRNAPGQTQSGRDRNDRQPALRSGASMPTSRSASPSMLNVSTSTIRAAPFQVLGWIDHNHIAPAPIATARMCVAILSFIGNSTWRCGWLLRGVRLGRPLRSHALPCYAHHCLTRMWLWKSSAQPEQCTTGAEGGAVQRVLHCTQSNLTRSGRGFSCKLC